MIALVVMFSVLFVYLLSRVLSYYFALGGVLYYLLDKYNDDLSVEEIKKLAIEARKHLR